MNTPDDFSQYYAELLDGIYDCVDRIVLNAFFPLGQTGGGMRSWWRQLHGDDSQLDDKHLREMAGTFSRRLHAFCAKQGIPIIEARSGERKHELAEPHVPKIRPFVACSWSSLGMHRRRSGKSNAAPMGALAKSATARTGRSSSITTFTSWIANGVM
jgi:hypothetical protein